MAAPNYDWPADLPAPLATSWFLQAETKSPGRALDGRRQVIYRENRYWTNRITLPQLWGERAAALQVLIDDLRGSYATVVLPVCNSFTLTYGGDEDAFYALFGLSAGEIIDGLTFGDGTRFDDDAGFEIPDHGDPVVTADVPAGATLIQLDGFLGDNLQPGGFFSKQGRLYRVVENDGVTIRFNPPLRVAIAAGETVAVNIPHCRMRLAQDDAGRVQWGARRIGSTGVIDLEEAFDR